MPGPFPGMDPYLESPLYWRGLHARLINQISDELQPQLLPRYVCMIEERVLLTPLEENRWPDLSILEREPEGSGGVAVAARTDADQRTKPEEIIVPEMTLPHRYLSIRDVTTREVVTVVELLSPWNKRGKGLADYQHKQEEVLLSETNLVEVDLLRGGQHAIAVPARRVASSDYRVSVHWGGSERFSLYRFSVRERLPEVVVPLREADGSALLDLERAFSHAYEHGAYRFVVDYSADPDPPLTTEDAAWAREQIARWRAERGHQTSSG